MFRPKTHIIKPQFFLKLGFYFIKFLNFYYDYSPRI